MFYVFHGLGGDASADYMERTAKVALGLGHAVWLVNHRGCGEGRGLAKHPYHSGRGDDVSATISLGRSLEPGKRHVAVGFSLGGNALLCLLTGIRGECLPDAAIAVNAPIDLAAAALRLTEGVNRIYDWRFVARLRGAVPSRPGPHISRSATLREFDALYTAPASGFASREEYYATCSTHTRLSAITVPTIVITSDDDPFVPVSAYRNATLSPAVRLHIEPRGGHMGYLTSRPTPLGSRRWLDYALRESMVALSP